MKVGRNDPCPCGSGVKVKRCCGVEGAQRSQEALEDLFGLAFSFPRQRPASASFDAWAQGAPDRLTRELVEEGLAQLGSSECERIPAEFAAAHPRVWESTVREAGSRDDASHFVLVGAVVAGLEEWKRPLDALALDLLETDADARDDPAEALALVLKAGDLWSVLEAVEAAEPFDRGAALTRVADDLWGEWHEQRLAVLVRRVRTRVPVAGYPAASFAIESACRAFEHDADVRHRLRSELLLDAMSFAAGAVPLAA
jgi:hypothetical protein